MAKLLPYYKMYPSDSDSDENFRLMNFEERGMYWTLLNHAWMNDGIPASDQDLIALLRIAPKDFERIWPRVSKCFPMNNERRTNPRQEEERTKAISKSEGCSFAVRSKNERRTIEHIRAYESESVSECSSEDLNKKNSESSLPRELKKLQDGWFSEFWNRYWRRIGKGQAKKKFGQVVKTQEQFDRVIQAIDLQSPWMLLRDSNHRPYPATWLNGEGWEDDADVQQVHQNGTGKKDIVQIMLEEERAKRA